MIKEIELSIRVWTKAQIRSQLDFFQLPSNGLSFLIYQFNPMKVGMKVVQLCLIICEPMNYTVHGILQARMQK